MKKIKIISCLILCLLYLGKTNLYAQIAGVTVTTVTFDFATKTMSDADMDKLQKLKTGDRYQIIVKNINSNLYKISLNKSDTTISAPLTVPSFGSFSLSDLSTLVGSLNTGGLSAPVVAPAPAVNPVVANFSAEQSAVWLKDKDNEVEFNMQEEENKKPLPKRRVITKFSIIKTIMLGYEKVLKDNLVLLKDVQKQTTDLINSYNMLIIQAQIEFQTDGSNDDFFGGNWSLNDLNTKFNDLNNKLDAIAKTVNDANEDYIAKSKKYHTEITNNPQLKSNDADIAKSYTSFTTTLKAAKDSLSSDKVLKYELSITNLLNNDQRTYTSAIQQFSKEQTALTMTFTPRSDNSNLQPYSFPNVFPLTKKDFWTVSSGIFVSTLYNQAYSTKKMPGTTAGDTTYTIVSENPSKYELGINSMVTYGTQISKNFWYWQVSAGPGVTISDKVRGRMMIGTGLAKGRRNKFVFDFGYITGYTDQLSVLYKNNLTQTTAPGNVTVSRLSSGGFLSIGYLFN